MVWRPSTLFAGIICPSGEYCDAISCMFSHKLPKEPDLSSQNGSKIELENTTRVQGPFAEAANEIISKGAPSSPHVRNAVVSTTLSKPVSPPAQKPKPGLKDGIKKAIKPQSLNPRLVPRAPMPHQQRTTFLKALHTELVKCNDDAKSKFRSDKDASSGLTLDSSEAIEVALTIEEQMARTGGANYASAMRSKVRAYKNMASEAWEKHIIAVFPEKEIKASSSDGKAARGSLYKSKLIRTVELQVLKHLVVKDLPALSPYGYIAIPPSDADVIESAAGVAISKNYECCDRCRSNFQVFPNRDEDGRLTSNGPCLYHPDKLEYPAHQGRSRKHLAGSGTLEPVFSCCYEGKGTRGCTELAYHVFKVTSAARLATVLPFISTPDNTSPSKGPRGQAVDAVTFDCEMGYTTLGFELLRLTAVTWPDGEALVDLAVRPLGILLDFNTRFSGVTQKDFDTARPYNKIVSSNGSEQLADGQLLMADSPQHAREILCSYITPETPLIGHAIENDLRVVRLCHPTVVDTVLLYPHPRNLPFRFRLQQLTKTHLKRKIQDQGPQGHDSLEDSIATGDLVRAKVQEKYISMKQSGWTDKNGKLIAPQSLKRGLEPALGANKKQKQEEPTLAEYLAMSNSVDGGL